MQKKLLYITTAYFIFLLCILMIFGYTPTNDGDGYIDLAKECIENGQPYPCMASITGKPILWNIGAVNFVIMSLLMFNSIVPLLVLYCLMKALSAFFIAAVAKHIFNAKVALYTLLIFVLYPNNWGQSTTLLSEIPSEFFMSLAFYLIIVKKSPWHSLAGGLLLAISNWFRPNILLMIVLLAAWIVIYKRETLMRKIPIFLSSFFIIIALIGCDNYIRTGHFVFQSQTFWYNMVDQCYGTSSASPHFGSTFTSEGESRYIEDMDNKTCFECNEIYKEQSILWLKSHPLEYAAKILPRLFYIYYNDIDNIAAFKSDKSNAIDNYVTIPYLSIFTKYKELTPLQWFAMLSMAIYYCIMLTAMLAIIVHLKNRNFHHIAFPFIMSVIASIVFVVLVHAETRYKSTFMPFVMMLSATFLQHISEHSNNTKPSSI